MTPPCVPGASHQRHGTHVAGTIAGKNVGVAKKAQVIAVGHVARASVRCTIPKA